MDKVKTLCGKLRSRSNISKHRRRCKICGTNIDGAIMTQAQHDAEFRLRQLEYKIDEMQNKPQIVQNNLIIFNFSADAQLNRDEVKQILDPPNESVPKYVKMKHFMYGGGNVKIESDKYIKVMENGQWELRDRASTIEELKATSIDELETKYKASENKNWKNWLINYNQKDNIRQSKLNKIVERIILQNQK